MCGIAGLVNKDGRPVDERELVGMCDVIRHRGPDDGGTFIEGSVGLGSRRLAIIDLSPAGHMPMASADGGLVIVYNGEIYNHIELRAELEAAGHRFRSGTDTEVILASYAQWGEDCLSRFNGMWGFALLDRARSKIFCARDRFGVKPFNYFDSPRRFGFGSEIKQLLPMVGARTADRALILDYLLTSATDYDQERSYFSEVRKLPAGHCLTYDLRAGSFSIRRWYVPAKVDLSGAGLPEIKAEFERRFTRSVALRLRSDVVVGTCLSGGLDSSVISAFASEMHRARGGKTSFKAVTAISVDPATDESAYAKAVVDRCGLDWVRTRPDHEQFVASLVDVMVAQEEPFPTPSMILQYFVMKAAREAGITVLLDGQGGDELLLGYPIHRGQHLRSIMRTRGPIAAAFELARLHRAGTVPIRTLLKYVVGSTSASARARFYSRRHRHLRQGGRIPGSLSWMQDGMPGMEDMQHLDVFRNVLPQLLRFEDRNSMAWSVESRLPFLDFNVAELCLSMPVEAKLGNGWSKFVLRQVAADHLPAEVAWRRSKFGFEAPDNDWLDPHRAIMRRDVISSPMLTSLCPPSDLGSAFDRLDQRSRWRLYCCALWERTYGITGFSD
jgi:asparagine synthase (glutamine-hydrolysing)